MNVCVGGGGGGEMGIPSRKKKNMTIDLEMGKHKSCLGDNA